MNARPCTDGFDCLRGLPADLDPPRFLRIGFAGETMRGDRPDGGHRMTPIAASQTIDDTLIMSGVEQGRKGPVGWTLVLNRMQGDMKLAVAGEGVSLTLFGACTPPEIQSVSAGSSTNE
jgi:hypothetical protein